MDFSDCFRGHGNLVGTGLRLKLHGLHLPYPVVMHTGSLLLALTVDLLDLYHRYQGGVKRRRVWHSFIFLPSELPW